MLTNVFWKPLPLLLEASISTIVFQGPNKQTIVYKEKELLFPKTTKDARIQIVEVRIIINKDIKKFKKEFIFCA